MPLFDQPISNNLWCKCPRSPQKGECPDAILRKIVYAASTKGTAKTSMAAPIFALPIMDSTAKK